MKHHATSHQCKNTHHKTKPTKQNVGTNNELPNAQNLNTNHILNGKHTQLCEHHPVKQQTANVSCPAAPLAPPASIACTASPMHQERRLGAGMDEPRGSLVRLLDFTGGCAALLRAIEIRRSTPKVKALERHSLECHRSRRVVWVQWTRTVYTHVRAKKAQT